MRLKHKQVVNTRAAHQAETLNALLRAEGAIPLAYPAIALAPPKDTRALDQALAGDYDLLVLTSANTVESIAQRTAALGLTLNSFPTAAVGAATAQAAQEKLSVNIVFKPNDANANTLAEQLAVTPGMRILLPQSEIARPVLAETLRARGAVVTTVTAYRTVRGSGGVSLMPMLSQGLVDAITFTSASTVHAFAERLREAGGTGLDGVVVACLSAQISTAARAEGYNVQAEAKTPTLAALLEALAGAFI